MLHCVQVLRPGVLWFLRNLNDQNFHPVQEVMSFDVTLSLSIVVVQCSDDKSTNDSSCKKIFDVFCE